METSPFQKWVNLSYFGVASLVGYILFAISLKLVGTYDLEARIHNVDMLVRVLSAVASLLVFVILYRHDQANQFMNEVMVELSRVTWPGQKETSNATVVVIVMVIISGLILGLFDQFWILLLKWVL